MIVATPKTQAELERLADSIARAICNCTADQKGDLLLAVSHFLGNYGAGYTSGLFQTIGMEYNRGKR